MQFVELYLHDHDSSVYICSHMNHSVHHGSVGRCSSRATLYAWIEPLCDACMRFICSRNIKTKNRLKHQRNLIDPRILHWCFINHMVNGRGKIIHTNNLTHPYYKWCVSANTLRFYADESLMCMPIVVVSYKFECCAKRNIFG